MEYRVYFYNFGYYSQNESSILEGAKEICRKAGFESRIEQKGELVASWSPISGFRYHKPERLSDDQICAAFTE